MEHRSGRLLLATAILDLAKLCEIQDGGLRLRRLQGHHDSDKFGNHWTEQILEKGRNPDPKLWEPFPSRNSHISMLVHGKCNEQKDFNMDFDMPVWIVAGLLMLWCSLSDGGQIRPGRGVGSAATYPHPLPRPDSPAQINMDLSQHHQDWTVSLFHMLPNHEQDPYIWTKPGRGWSALPASSLVSLLYF